MEKKKRALNKKLKEWTVMVYMAGDNNLSDECLWAIKEMYRVGLQGDDVAVVTLYESKARGVPIICYDMGNLPEPEAGSEPDVYPDESVKVIPVRNYTVDGGLEQWGKELPKIKQFVSATELIKFIQYCVKKYPAQRYMVVLSGHGAGAVGKNFLKEERQGRYLSIPMLRYALGEVNKGLSKNPGGKKIDILGLDACAMSMVEVAYEMRDVVNFMVGAEGFEINTGWPYHRILEALPGIIMDPKGLEPAQALASAVVDRYVTYYSDFAVAGVSVDQAACDLSQAVQLKDAVKQLVQTLRVKIPLKRAAHKKASTRSAAKKPIKSALLDAVILAHWRAQSYKFEEYVDLWDFCDLLQAGCTDEDVQSACAKVKEAIGFEGVTQEKIRDSEHARLGFSKPIGRCVLKSCFSGAAYQHSHGLSIYFPWAAVSSNYKNLRFAKQSGWYDFLEDYVEQTRREPRPGSGKLRHIFVTDDAGDEVRFGPPYDRFGPPYDRMGNTITPKMKNPPNGFYTDECVPTFME